jgi:Secretion system C-terminal sorting domain
MQKIIIFFVLLMSSKVAIGQAVPNCQNGQVYQCVATIQYDVAGNCTASYQTCGCISPPTFRSGQRLAQSPPPSSDAAPISIADEQEANIVAIGKIFPNPTNANVIVTLTAAGAGTLIISDAMGRVVGQQAFNGQEVIVSLNDYPSGLYVISLNSQAHKVVKVE